MGLGERGGALQGDYLMQKAEKIARLKRSLIIIGHANEHMGQLVACARMNGVVPPWSETRK